MSATTRQEVLGLYRKIFRIAKKWHSASGVKEETIKEKQYIVDEARTLFNKNKHVTDIETINQCIEECRARVEIGLHYGIPYPRPVSKAIDVGIKNHIVCSEIFYFYCLTILFIFRLKICLSRWSHCENKGVIQRLPNLPPN
uniref:LYR motif containing 1 n=1 Tax=Leptobrachium leishanense TaxID=445787 RepID=A0A8C5QTD5_9ANUR